MSGSGEPAANPPPSTRDEPRLRLRSQQLEWREVEGEVVALDLRQLRYLGVNRSGAVLWPALVEGATRAELVELLVARFDVDPRQAAADIDAFLSVLADRQLLEP